MPKGKKPNQRMKHYLVYEYLRRNTNENNTASANTIAEYISGEYGISAERRSIYKDIEELNAILYMLDNDISFSDAFDELAEDDTDELKSIVYNKTKKGFYLKRKYELDECVYSSRFLTQYQSELLSGIVFDLVSEHQKDNLMHDVLLTDRVRTSNKEVLANIGTTNEPREGEDAFLATDLKSYTKRVFNMFGGKERQITLRCVISLLDTMVDRFGTKDATYKKLDDNHFAVTAQMEVSDQFYGWLCGFGKRVRIISPVDVKQNFGEYLSKIRDMYEDVIT